LSGSHEPIETVSTPGSKQLTLR